MYQRTMNRMVLQGTGHHTFSEKKTNKISLNGVISFGMWHVIRHTGSSGGERQSAHRIVRRLSLELNGRGKLTLWNSMWSSEPSWWIDWWTVGNSLTHCCSAAFYRRHQTRRSPHCCQRHNVHLFVVGKTRNCSRTQGTKNTCFIYVFDIG